MCEGEDLVSRTHLALTYREGSCRQRQPEHCILWDCPEKTRGDQTRIASWRDFTWPRTIWRSMDHAWIHDALPSMRCHTQAQTHSGTGIQLTRATIDIKGTQEELQDRQWRRGCHQFASASTSWRQKNTDHVFLSPVGARCYNKSWKQMATRCYLQSFCSCRHQRKMYALEQTPIRFRCQRWLGS